MWGFFAATAPPTLRWYSIAMENIRCRVESSLKRLFKRNATIVTVFQTSVFFMCGVWKMCFSGQMSIKANFCDKLTDSHNRSPPVNHHRLCFNMTIMWELTVLQPSTVPQNHWFTSAMISLIQRVTCAQSAISNCQLQSPAAFLSTEASLWPHVGFITSEGGMLVNLFQPSMLGLHLTCPMMGLGLNKDHVGSLGHLNKQPNGEICKLIEEKKKHLFFKNRAKHCRCESRVEDGTLTLYHSWLLFML